MHSLPKDVRKELIDKNVLGLWNGLTPLAKNEWICWIISVKKDETRINHVRRLSEDLKKK